MTWSFRRGCKAQKKRSAPQLEGAPFLSFSQGLVVGSTCRPYLSLVGECRHARQRLAFEQLERGAAAGGAMADFVDDFGLLGGRCRVAATDDGDGSGLGGLDDGRGYCLGACGEGFELEYADRSVPDDGLGLLDRCSEELARLGTAVEPLPAVGDAGLVGGRTGRRIG